MKLLTKIFIAAAAFTVCALNAEEINLAKNNVIKDAWGSKITFDGDQFSTNGKAFIVMKEIFDIDFSKTYSFTLTAVGNKVKPTKLFVGFDILDENGKSIPALHLQGLHFTRTTLAKEAKKGDTVIYVKNARAWVRGPSICIMKNAKADNSDIPNGNIVAENVVKSEKEGNIWKVTLNVPVKEDLPVDTSVRLHIKGGFYYCVNQMVPVDGEITVSGSVSGLPPFLQQYNAKNWPHGAKKACFIILADWNNSKTPAIFKNATFSIK